MVDGDGRGAMGGSLTWRFGEGDRRETVYRRRINSYGFSNVTVVVWRWVTLGGSVNHR